MTDPDRPAVLRAREMGQLLRAARSPAARRRPGLPAIDVWLAATFAAVEAEVRAELHDDNGDTGGCGWIAGVDPVEDEAELCSCGLAFRRARDLHAVEVDRRLVAEHELEGKVRPSALDVCQLCSRGESCGCCAPPVPYPCSSVRLVASRYRGWPGYRTEWAP